MIFELYYIKKRMWISLMPEVKIAKITYTQKLTIFLNTLDKVAASVAAQEREKAQVGFPTPFITLLLL